jgi:hypothetical protein
MAPAQGDTAVDQQLSKTILNLSLMALSKENLNPWFKSDLPLFSLD